jgi:DNA polymerase-3 subunit gamma/tau
VTVDVLRQAWPNVVEAIKAKGRVAGLMVGNASVASFDEGVLTLRFPRQGEVKGFQGSKYEDLLKQALTAMFGINVVVRATWGGDTPPAGRRPGPGPGPAAPPAPNVQSPSGQPWGQPSPGQPPAAAGPADDPPGQDPSASRAAAPSPGGQSSRAERAAAVAGPPGGSSVNGGGGATHPFGGSVISAGDLPQLPPPPSPDDEEFDPDDEDLSSSTTVHDLTGMALVQRELGAEIIAEYED